MTNTLVFPLPHFQTLLRMLAAGPNRMVRCLVGMSHLASETQYLVRRIEGDDARLSAREREHSICISMGTDGSQPDGSPVSESLGALSFGNDAMGGEWRGLVTTASGAIEPLDRILLVGAGMHVLTAFSLSPPPWTPAWTGGKLGQGTGVREVSPLPPVGEGMGVRGMYPRFSRTIGALGIRHWRRLTSLGVAVIGCGRSGSIAATTLARLGVQALTLIEPDLVEAHNLAEMDGVSDADIGRLKVEALADFLQAHCASAEMPLQITTVPQSITAAHRSALPAEILLCCVDNDAARLACGILAALFHKVLVDIGTGVFNEGNGNRTMGADVRLILPADGCLRCTGSVANYDEGIKNLIRCNLSGEKGRQQEQWWTRRSGSLRTLNMMAVSVGVQLLCDLVAERVRNSRWVRLEYDENGTLTVQRVDRSKTETSSQCPLCAKAGMGEKSLLWV